MAIAPCGVAAQVVAKILFLPVAEARITFIDIRVVLGKIVECIAVGIKHMFEGILEHDEGGRLKDVGDLVGGRYNAVVCSDVLALPPSVGGLSRGWIDAIIDTVEAVCLVKVIGVEDGAFGVWIHEAC